jgi:hypothetical protein
MRWAGYVAQIGRRRMYIGHWSESQKEKKKPIGRPRRRLVDNIKIDLREIVWGCMDCIDLAQDRDQ